MGGYYIVFWGLRVKADREIVSKIENNTYNSEETVLIKVPFSLPYPVSEDFQFVKGKFEHRGEYYKLIKQKLEGDTLYILCIKDSKEKHLNNKMIEYGSLSNDLPRQSKQSQNLLSKLLKEYEPFRQLVFATEEGWVASLTFSHLSFRILEIEQLIQSPPPKSIC